MNASRILWRSIAAGAVLSALLLPSALAAGAAAGADAVHTVDPGSIRWRDAPPSLPRGARAVVLHGDPSRPGPMTVRLMLPAGYKVAPHRHTQAENLTVLSGTLWLGMGEKADPAQAHALKAGGFHYLPGGTPHYVYAKVPTVVQAHGDGPFDIVYVDPADDPARAHASASK